MRTFTPGHRRRLERAAEIYLEQCYQSRKPVRGKEFAETLDLTPEYASWLATQVLGRSLVEWFRERQLDYAAGLLKRTPLSVEEVAVRAGFGTRATLHRVFVKAKGVTPAAFRALKK